LIYSIYSDVCIVGICSSVDLNPVGLKNVKRCFIRKFIEQSFRLFGSFSGGFTAILSNYWVVLRCSSFCRFVCR